MAKRGKKSKNGVSFVPECEMIPFKKDIKGIMKELHVAIQLYEIELMEQGYTQNQATMMAAKDCIAIKNEIIREDAERML